VFSALPRRFPALQLAARLDELQLRTDVLIGGLVALPVIW
jgi:pentalenolactone synthase